MSRASLLSAFRGDTLRPGWADERRYLGPLASVACEWRYRRVRQARAERRGTLRPMLAQAWKDMRS